MRDTAYFCPECGAASVEYSTLVGGLATCKVCSWTGPATGLVSTTFEQQVGTSDDALRMILSDVRAAYRRSAVHFAHLLKKWGFLETGEPGKTATRYIASMAMASFLAILKTRQEIEKERVNAS